MRPENEPTQSSCRNRRDKNCPGRDVLCLLHAMMKVRLNHIAKILEGGIEGFGNPDQRNGQHDPEPFGSVQPNAGSGCADSNGNQQVNLGVVLVAQHVANTGPREAEAAQPGGDAEALRAQWGGRHSTPAEPGAPRLPVSRKAAASIKAIMAQQGIRHLSRWA